MLKISTPYVVVSLLGNSKNQGWLTTPFITLPLFIEEQKGTNIGTMYK